MNVGYDPGFTLGEWAMFIALLIMEFGEETVLSTDGGHNNVGLELSPGIEHWIPIHQGKMNINPRLGGDS